MKAESIGNLREAAYNFKRLWFSKRADELRREIKKTKCHCPLANAGYTNMLHDPKTLVRVGWNCIKT
jgi:hypothetical protein